MSKQDVISSIKYLIEKISTGELTSEEKQIVNDLCEFRMTRKLTAAQEEITLLKAKLEKAVEHTDYFIFNFVSFSLHSTYKKQCEKELNATTLESLKK